ncbi:MAG: hypothetical protein J5771_07380 [Bacteroidales bacterium]|nr:hypothetical protein [Bacteroidales bacterium]
MKTISKIALFFATASLFALASCQPEEKYSTGSKEDPNCYDVYFPVQDVLKGLVKDPSEPTFDTIWVSRTKTEGEIVVPLEAVDPSDSVFTVTELKFEDGQADTCIVVTYDKAQVGTEYTLQLRIKGDEYASKYGTKSTVADFSVIRVLWKSLGKGTLVDNWVFEFVDDDIEVQVRDDDHSIYRIVSPFGAASAADLGVDMSDEYLMFRILKKGITFKGVEISKDDIIYYDYYNTGAYHSGYGAFIYMIHPLQIFSAPTIDDCVNNCVLSYQDEDAEKNVYPAVVQFAPVFYMFGVGGWDHTADEDMVKFYFPGVPVVDYTLEIESAEAEAGVLPVQFATGVDIDTVKYAVFEGSLTTGQVNSKAKAIEAGEVAGSAFFLPDPANQSAEDGLIYTTLGLTLDSTMVYTLVAVGKEDSVVVATGSNVFKYMKAGDDVPFVIAGSLESTKKYEPLGTKYSSDSLLAYFVYADETVTTLKAAIYENKTFIKKADDCWKDLLSEKPALAVDTVVTKPELAQGLGLEGIQLDLLPGTEYALLIYASNGYKIQTAAYVAKTTGIAPLPVYKSYTYANREASLIDGKEASDFFKTYNLYAVDAYVAGNSSVREYMGKATIAAFDETKYGPIDPASPAEGEYVQVSGLLCGRGPAGFDDTVIFDYCADPFGLGADSPDALGFFGPAFMATADSTCALYTYLAGGWRKSSYASVIYPVAEGYLAIVGESYYTTNYNYFSTINFYIPGATDADPDILDEAFANYLLVDPAKDDNGLAPSTLHRVQKSISKIQRYHNCVETAAGCAASRKELARDLQKSFNYSGSHKTLAASAKSVSVKAQQLQSKKPAAKKASKKSAPSKKYKMTKNVRTSWQ